MRRTRRLGLSPSEIFGSAPQDQPTPPKAKTKPKAKAKPEVAKPVAAKTVAKSKPATPKKNPTVKKTPRAPRVSPPVSHALVVREEVALVQEPAPSHAEAVSWKAGYLLGATLMRFLSIFRWRKRRKS